MARRRAQIAALELAERQRLMKKEKELAELIRTDLPAFIREYHKCRMHFEARYAELVIALQKVGITVGHMISTRRIDGGFHTYYEARGINITETPNWNKIKHTYLQNRLDREYTWRVLQLFDIIHKKAMGPRGRKVRATRKQLAVLPTNLADNLTIISNFIHAHGQEYS